MGYKENPTGSTTAPYVVTLGTAGGPRWWTDSQGQPRQGIATAVVVEDGWYLVDCGSGVGRQIRSAGLSMVDLKGIFITHMHSDHIVDLASLMLFAPFEIKDSQKPPIPIFGPGSRGRITPMSPRAQSTPEPVNPNEPGGGIESTFAGLVSAFSAAFKDRMIISRLTTSRSQRPCISTRMKMSPRRWIRWRYSRTRAFRCGQRWYRITRRRRPSASVSIRRPAQSRSPVILPRARTSSNWP